MKTKQMAQHTSHRFDMELEDIRQQVQAMGGLVEQQLAHAVTALIHGDRDLAETVMTSDYKINAMEVSIDEACTYVLVRRQPVATDLRLILSVIKTITDLERIGDEAERVGHMAMQLRETADTHPQTVQLEHLGQQVKRMLRKALDAFARFDVDTAVEVAHEDLKADREYEAIMRQMITYMMEDPHTIPQALNLIWAARALERIGDRSRNICEYIIYLVRGKDVRHTSLETMVEEAASGGDSDKSSQRE